MPVPLLLITKDGNPKMHHSYRTQREPPWMRSTNGLSRPCPAQQLGLGRGREGAVGGEWIAKNGVMERLLSCILAIVIAIAATVVIIITAIIIIITISTTTSTHHGSRRRLRSRQHGTHCFLHAGNRAD